MFGLTLASGSGATFFQMITLTLPALYLVRFRFRLLYFFRVQFVVFVMLIAVGVLGPVSYCLVDLKRKQGISSGSLKADGHLSNVL